MLCCIEIETEDGHLIQELKALQETTDEVDIIESKNFNGDITTIELYVSLSINIIAVIVPVIKMYIENKKVSKMTIDGDRIELSNVSEELIKETLEKKLLVSSAGSGSEAK